MGRMMGMETQVDREIMENLILVIMEVIVEVTIITIRLGRRTTQQMVTEGHTYLLILPLLSTSPKSSARTVSCPYTSQQTSTPSTHKGLRTKSSASL